MKYDIIELAFKSALVNHNLEAKDKNLILQAYDELLETKHQFPTNDAEDIHLYLVTPFDLVNLLNSATYTVFSQTVKELNPTDERFPGVKALARDYHKKLINHGEYESLTYRHCLDACDFLSDLWRDNESNNLHLPNGQCSTIETTLLRHIVNKHMEELKTNLGEMSYKTYCERIELPEWQADWLLNHLDVQGGESNG